MVAKAARTLVPAIGRGPARDAVVALIRGSRLVTVCGAPGVGKARLVSEIAAAEDDAVYLDLRELRGDGVGDDTERAAELARSYALVALGGVDEDREAALRLVDALLGAEHGPTVLIAARRRLERPGERVYALAPLDPDDAIALLADGLGPGPVDRVQLARIAAAVDGIPLALELAAERAAVLGVHAVAELVSAGGESLLDVLASARPDRRAHHASIRAALGRALDGLPADTQAAFGAMALFQGPFTLDDARAVGGDDVPVTVDHVHALCAGSLVERVPGSDRFRLLAPLRACGAARVDLGAPAVAAVLARRHADVALADPVGREADLCAIARDGEARRRGLGPVDALRAWVAQVPAALERGPVAPIVDGIERTLAAGGSSGPEGRHGFSGPEGRHGFSGPEGRRGASGPEGRHGAGVPHAIAAAAHLAAARVRRRLGEREGASVHLERAAAASRACRAPDPAVDARIRTDRDALDGARTPGPRTALDELHAGIALRDAGRPVDALAALDRAWAGFRAAGDRAQLPVTLAEIAHCHLDLGDRDDLGLARAWLDEAEASAGPAPTTRAVAALASRRGLIALLTGEDAVADAWFERAERALAAVGYRRSAAGMHGYRGVVALRAGRTAEAVARFERARDAVDDEPRARTLLSGWLAAARAVDGDPDGARRAMLGAPEPIGADPLLVAGHVVAATRDAVLGDAAAAAAKRALAQLGGDDSLAARSLDVRLAVRFLDACATGDGADGEVAVDGARGRAALVVAGDGGSFSVPGAEAPFAERSAAGRRILVALARARLASPGASVPWDALVAAGWPGERIAGEAGRNRVKVAIATLRRSGLRSLVEHHAGGYRLDPAVPLALG